VAVEILKINYKNWR